MSSPSLPKSFPALFNLENRAKTGALLLQPMSLAVLASLGVHGLLWFGLPLMSASEPQQADSQRSVPLVELSPVEQARLPQLSNSPLLGLPKPSVETTSIVPNSLTTVPVDPETPQDSTSYDSVLSQPSTIIRYSVAPPSKRSPQKSTDEATVDSDPTTQPSDQETEAKTEPAEKENAEPPISSKAEDLLPSKPPEDQAKIALQQKFAYSAANTSPDDFNNNAKSFSKTAQEVSKGDLSEDWKKLDAMTAPYPKDACQFKQDDKAIAGETWVGVIVQPNGKLAAKPILLKSSGFKGLDEAAAEFMTQYAFEAGKQYRGFYVPIKFELNKTDCVAADTSDPTS